MILRHKYKYRNNPTNVKFIHKEERIATVAINTSINLSLKLSSLFYHERQQSSSKYFQTKTTLGIVLCSFRPFSMPCPRERHDNLKENEQPFTPQRIFLHRYSMMFTNMCNIRTVRRIRQVSLNFCEIRLSYRNSSSTTSK